MRLTTSRNCYCGPGAIRHDYGDGKHCKSTPTAAATAQQPHEIHDDVFEEAHAAAAGAVMGARMAGKQIPAWTPDMNDAFRAAVAEAFDAGFRFGQEAAR